MQKSLIFLVVLLLAPTIKTRSQEKLNTLNVDIQTYHLFEQEQWKSLVGMGKSARQQGIDFYYLRYRMGISYFELKKYRQAIPFFEQIVEQSPEDKTALEYLYFSYLFSGRQEDGRMLSNRFDPTLKKQLNIPRKDLIAHAVGAEYKHYRFQDYAQSDLSNDQSLKQTIRENLHYFNLNFTHYSDKSFSLFHAFSFLLGNNRIFDPETEAYEFDENLKQFQYYIAGNWHLGKGFDMTIAFHFLQITLEGLNPDQGKGRNTKHLYVTHNDDYVGFLRFSKSISNFNLRLSTTISGLNGGMQYMPLAGFDYYPFSNTTLYFSTDAAYMVAPGVEQYNPGLIFKQKIGIRIISPLWLEPFAQIGKVSNYADEDAYVIYNNRDVIDYWFGARMNLFLVDSRLNLYYIFQQYKNTNYFTFTDEEEFSQTAYFSSTHLLGLRWKLK